MKSYCLLFSLLLAIACQKEQKNQEFSYKNFIIAQRKLNVDSINFLRSNTKIAQINDIEYLVSLYKNQGELIVYNAADFSIIYSKELFPNYGVIQDFYIHNFDSIYGLYYGNKIRLIDTAFIIKAEFFVNDYSKEFGSEYTLSSADFSDPFLVVNDTAYMTHYPNYVLDSKKNLKKYFSNKLGISLLLGDTSKIVDYGCNFPDNYSKRIYHSFRPYRLFTSSSEIYSFEVNDSLFINRKDGTYKKKLLKSNYFKDNYEFDCTKKSFQYSRKYEIENFSYHKLYYDKYREQYYRVCSHKLNYENKDGSINIYDDKTWSIVVADKDFNVLKKVLFPPSYTRNIFITKAGVLINKYTNQDEIIFDIFNF